MGRLIIQLPQKVIQRVAAKMRQHPVLIRIMLDVQRHLQIRLETILK
jgi:hypothetical protein